MRVLVQKAPLRRTLQWTQRVFLCAAILFLGYCGFVLADSWMFQRGEGRQFERLLADGRKPASPLLSAPAATSGLIGRIEIIRIGISAIVVEGTSTATLRRAVGHVPGTPMPGQSGNVAFTGHRDTFFRPLRNIRGNDIIVVTTLQGEYRYRVVSTKVVGPHDVSVLDPSGNQILTLVTCYPFYFVGAAPDRFIVRAERVI